MIISAALLMLIRTVCPVLAGTPFYGPEVPCIDWMTKGNFLIANCPGPEITSMTVLDLNHCYASDKGHIVARDNGGFNSEGHCTFSPLLNGQKDLTVVCPTPDHKVNITSTVALAHVENRDSMLACGGITSCYIDSPGCLGCGDTWIKDGLRCK